jgi:hypothetical protein
MSTIHVSLDTSADPPVTCSPKHQDINRGSDPINWKPAAQQSFTFSSLTGLSDPPFTAPVVCDDEITSTDSNAGAGDYPYTLTVMLNGVPYNTDSSTGTGGGDPTIKNK